MKHCLHFLLLAYSLQMAQSAELLREVSQLWHNGGAGTASAHKVAITIIHYFNGLAAALTSDGKHDERLDRWLFFVSTGGQRQCIQLRGKPQGVDYSLSVPAASHRLQRKTFKERAAAKDHADCRRRLRELQQAARTEGAATASDVLASPNHFACRVLHIVQMPEGTVHFHMWRCDLVAMVMAQRGLKRATSVPFKVWRRQLKYQWDNQPLDVDSTMLLGGLVCWDAGRCPARSGSVHAAWRGSAAGSASALAGRGVTTDGARQSGLLLRRQPTLSNLRIQSSESMFLTWVLTRTLLWSASQAGST